MRYLIALIFPPLAILLCGKLIQFLLNAVLWLGALFLTMISFPLVVLFIVPVIHAILVVNSHLADRRTKKIIKAVKGKK